MEAVERPSRLFGACPSVGVERMGRGGAVLMASGFGRGGAMADPRTAGAEAFRRALGLRFLDGSFLGVRAELPTKGL